MLELHAWRITGISPLLQNNPATTMMMSADTGLSVGRKRYDDKNEAEIRTYKNAAGNYVHPTAGFRSGFLVAASGRKIARKSAKAILAGSVFPTEVEAILLDEKGKPITKYELHKSRVMVGKAGVLRVRPMYWPWACLLAVDVDRDFIGDLSVITEILNIAGRIIGIGDYRPDTSKGKSGVGTFGRYEASLVK